MRKNNTKILLNQAYSNFCGIMALILMVVHSIVSNLISNTRVLSQISIMIFCTSLLIAMFWRRKLTVLLIDNSIRTTLILNRLTTYAGISNYISYMFTLTTLLAVGLL